MAAAAQTMAGATFFEHVLNGDPEWMFNPAPQLFVQQKLQAIFVDSQSAAATFAAADGRQSALGGLQATAAANQAMAAQLGDWIGINLVPPPPPAPLPAPTVTINQAAGQFDPTSTGPIQFTVVFSKPVTGFAASDVSLSGSSLTGLTASVSGSGRNYTVSVTGMTGSGTVVATIPAGAAEGAAGYCLVRPPPAPTTRSPCIRPDGRRHDRHHARSERAGLDGTWDPGAQDLGPGTGDRRPGPGWGLDHGVLHRLARLQRDSIRRQAEPVGRGDVLADRLDPGLAAGYPRNEARRYSTAVRPLGSRLRGRGEPTTSPTPTSCSRSNSSRTPNRHLPRCRQPAQRSLRRLPALLVSIKPPAGTRPSRASLRPSA